MRPAFYEGTSDPLDQAVDIGPDNNFADWFASQAPSPEQLLIACEEADEAEGCVCGTHLDEQCRRTFPLTSKKD